MNFSRRGFLKGALAAAGAAAGSRMGGPLVKSALADTGETSHLVHIYFNGGFNAYFAGQAKLFAGKAFGVADNTTTIKDIGNGLTTDAATFGTLPQFALDHWGAVGIIHGQALHTTPQNLKSGGERALLINGDHSYLNELAAAMGGDSAYKAVYFGDREVAYNKDIKAFQGVPLQRISDLKEALKSTGAGAPDPTDPSRPSAAAALETSQALSQREIGTNPGRLTPLTEAYNSSVASLKKAPPKPVTFEELDTAYGLGGKSDVTSVYAAMLAGAELMIRSGGSNVVHIGDYGLASWDFHQVSGGTSQNVTFSRNKFQGNKGGFGSSRINPLKTFITRMMNQPDRNVVVAVSGELVRLPSGDHGDGTVAVLFGKYVKPGVSLGVTSSNARFDANLTPGPKAFWAAAAAALKVPGAPFGPNPHAKLIG
jgi:hypothetical protein